MLLPPLEEGLGIRIYFRRTSSRSLWN